MSQQIETVMEQLKALSQQRAEAELHGEVAALQRLLADDFVGVGPRGFTLTKEHWLDRARSGDLVYEALDWQTEQTRIYGDAAIVIGQESSRARYQGQEVAGQYRETQLYVRQEGRWRLASLHLSPIAGPPPDSQSGR